MNKRLRLGGRHFLNFAAIGLTVAAASFMWPAVLGGSSQVIAVHGHSMEPTYFSGDLVVLDTEAAPEIGNVIVFHIPQDEPADGQLVVHRVVGVRDDGTYITQGDNAANPDVFLTTRADIVGSPRFSVPHGGQAIATVGSPIGLAAVTGGLCTVLLWPRKQTSQVVVEDESASQTSLSDLVAACEPHGFTESIVFSDKEMADAQIWVQSQLASLAR